MFWHGRARWHSRLEPFCEWLFGRAATTFHLQLWFGHGDNEDGVMLSFGLPWLFSVYIGLEGVFRCKECYSGVGIHSSAIWFYPLPYSMSTTTSDPWYRHTYCWNFPWQLDWWSTEVLEHKANLPCLAQTVWSENKKNRRRGFDMEGMRTRAEAELSVSQDYPYTYKRKSGEIQARTATVHVVRMTWRARWWPIIPRQMVRTSIEVKFSDEVGEGIGTWKGGCIGCGYDMLPGETPLETLRRMERERIFKR